MSAWLQRLEALADRFIPPAILTGSPEVARQARFAVGIAWLGGAFLVVAVFVQGPVNSRALLVLNLLSALLCFVAPFFLRWSGRPALVCHALLGVAFCKYVSVALLLRGAGLTGASVFLAQLPLFATLLLGVRAGAVWAFLTTGAGVAIGLAGHAGVIHDRLPASQRLVNDHFVLAACTLVLFCIAAIYERRKNTAQRQLHELARQHQAAEIERIQAVSRLHLGESEHLASLGRVAAATAHEINNPLAATVANLELLAAHPLRPDMSAAVEDALAGARRIGRIVTDLELCSRARSERVSSVKVADAIERALAMATPHTVGRARLRHHVDEPLPPVRGELSRLSRAIVNLVLNAAEAMPEGQAGENDIVIEAGVAGDGVVVEVRDNGPGIPPQLFDKVKEPFFTSKAIGEGKGLGLAICEGIVQSFGGTMTIESRPGRTAVRLMLLTAPPEAPAPSPPPAARQSTLEILVVDDEEAVARTLRRILSAHSVTVANGGGQALEILAAEKRFDVIFCDLMMPELTGMDVFERLQASRPELAERVIFMSGGTFTERARAFRQAVRNDFLEKPFSVASVRNLVKKYL